MGYVEKPQTTNFSSQKEQHDFCFIVNVFGTRRKECSSQKTVTAWIPSCIKQTSTISPLVITLNL